MDIYELARIAKVAPSTASKALNGTGQLKPETREHVLGLARKHNFQPSHSARSLARRKTDNIGVVVLRRFSAAAISNPFNSRVIEGVETHCVEQEYNIIFSVIPWDGKETLALPKIIRQRIVDGVILLGSMPAKFVEAVAASKIPMATVDLECRPEDGDSHLIDNENGAAEAVRHLVGLGHSRIAMVVGDPEDASFAARKRGFLGALKAAGLAPSALAEDLVRREKDDSWMLPLLKGPARPTAVFCCNDDHAIRLQALALGLGLGLPDDLSIVGFDDIDWAQLCRPSLTTLRVDKPRLGSDAARRLISRIKDPALPHQTLIQPVSLAIRESSARYKG